MTDALSKDDLSQGQIDLLPRLVAGSHLGSVNSNDEGVEVRGGAVAWSYAAIAPFSADEPVLIVAEVSPKAGRMSVGILSAARDDVWHEEELVGPGPHRVEIRIVDAAACGGVVFRTWQDGSVAPVASVSRLAIEALPADAPERLAAAILSSDRTAGGVTDQISSAYWTRHNVTFHKRFRSAAESLEYFHWRNDQYFNYIELMPVAGFDGQTVLDYGCGPGHDMVGFGCYSKPARLVGADVSPSSLAETALRLGLHDIKAELIRLDLADEALPFEDATFDHIHSSGVLHHTPDPVLLLRELRRVLKPGGTMNVMIYNYDSLALHMDVAYVKRIVNGLYRDLDIREAFKHTTDGVDCPISNVYKPEEWIEICRSAGFDARFTGVGVGLGECELAARRFDACKHPDLPAESRVFLRELTFDERGLPYYRGQLAGIDACFVLTQAS